MTLEEAKAYIERLEKAGDMMRSMLDDGLGSYTSAQRLEAVFEWEEERYFRCPRRSHE